MICPIKKQSFGFCSGTALHRAVQMGNAVMAKSLLGNKSVWIDEEDGRGKHFSGNSKKNWSTEVSHNFSYVNKGLGKRQQSQILYDKFFNHFNPKKVVRQTLPAKWFCRSLNGTSSFNH